MERSHGDAGADDSSAAVLRDLFSQPAQTYDQFLNSFTQLKKEDLVKAAVKKVEREFSVNKEANIKEDTSEESRTPPNLTPTVQLTEEEVTQLDLPSSTAQSDYLTRDRSIPLKFGNFVEDKEVEASESDYVPSSSVPHTAAVLGTQSQKTLKSEALAAQPSPSVTVRSQESINGDVDGELLELLPENSTGPVTASVLGEELKASRDESPSAASRADPMAALGALQEVSLGSVDPRTFVYPGEAPPDVSPGDPPASGQGSTPHVTLLPFRNSAHNTVCTATQQQAYDDETNEVLTFKLDEDFDYDNVTLSSKFSPEELNKIKGKMYS